MPDPRIVLALAARAGCDPRSARDYLSGRLPRGNLLRARLAEGVAELGVERPSAPPARTISLSESTHEAD